MRHFFFSICLAACITLGMSCTDYQTQIDDLKKQIDDLSQICERSESNIDALEGAIDAIKSGNPVKSIIPVSENGSVTGYTLTFKDGSSVTVYNQASNVSVGEDNGRYYWKADGEWLKDSKGSRIEVGGDKAPAPQFKVEDCTLKMSLDGGKTWNEAAQMEKPYIARIEDTPAAVIITLTEGGTITIPKEQATEVTFVADTVRVFDGMTAVASYSLTGVSAGTKVYAFGSNGWKAEVTEQSAGGGKVSVTAPAGAADADVVLTASDSEGRTYLASIRCIARGVQPKFEILAYASFGGTAATRERYLDMAAAGFTISSAGFAYGKWGGPLDIDLTLAGLDAAQGTGVKLCIPIGDFFGGEFQQTVTLEQYINAVKDHPALWGYIVGDEPNASQLGHYAEMVEEMRKYDPVHPWYTVFLPVAAGINNPDANLNGTDTHKEYVEAACKYHLEHPTQFLAFDFYPVRTGNQVAFWWYSTLEDYFHYAQEYDLPLSGFACSVVFDGQEFPSVEALRLQNYTNLAYGCQAIQYFTYVCPPYQSEGWLDGSAPMNRDLSLSPVYDMVKQVNAELNNQAWVFLGGKVKWVRHTTSVEALPGTFPTSKLSVANFTSVGFDYFKASQHAVVSLIENEGCRYLIIVNQSLGIVNKLSMELNEEGRKAQIVNKDGSLTPVTDFVSDDNPIYSLDKGDALILKLD